jgi:NarL family two-component system response regulator LiaR
MLQVSLEQATKIRSSGGNTMATMDLLDPITVLVVDDHALMRSAISQILTANAGIKQVLTAQDYTEAEHLAIKHAPDVIWLDMHIGNDDSITEIQQLRKVSPHSFILAIADIENEQEAFAAIMTGAQGYCSKQDVHPDDIMEMIGMIRRGEYVLRPVLVSRLLQRLRAAAMPLWASENRSGNHTLLRNVELNGIASLTTREREILQLISQGYRDRDIAEGLHISEKTVQKHVQNILNKLGAQNRTEAAYLIHSQSNLQEA